MKNSNTNNWLKIILEGIPKLTNKKEILKALKHYKKGSEKYKAMLYCLKDTFLRYYVPDESTDLYNGNMVLDAEQITANYLIENIEYTFQAIDRFPWAKRVYKEDKVKFFREVLPYRVGSTKLIQLGPIKRHWRAMFLEKDVYDSIQKSLKLEVDYETIIENVEKFSEDYSNAKTSKERVQTLVNLTAFFDINVYHLPENVQYFPRGMGEQTIWEILTPGTNFSSPAPGKLKDDPAERGGRCTDLDALLRQTLMAFGVPVTSLRFPAFPLAEDNHEILHMEWEGQKFYLSPCTHGSMDPSFMHESYKQIGCALVEKWGDWNGEATKIILNAAVEVPFCVEFYRKTRSVFNYTAELDKVRVMDVSSFVTKQPKGTYVYLGVLNNISKSIAKDGSIASIASIDVTKSTGSKMIFENVDTEEILYFPHIYYRELSQDVTEVIGKPFALFDKKTVFFKDKPEGDGLTVDVNVLNDEVAPSTQYGMYWFNEENWVLQSKFTTDSKGNATIDGVYKELIYAFADKDMQFIHPWYLQKDGTKYIFKPKPNPAMEKLLEMRKNI